MPVLCVLCVLCVLSVLSVLSVPFVPSVRPVLRRLLWIDDIKRKQSQGFKHWHHIAILYYQNDTKLTPSWSWSQRSKHASFESHSAPPFKPTWTWACWGFFSEQLTIKLGVKYLIETWYFPSCTCRVCKDHLFSLLADISVMEVARPCPIVTEASWTIISNRDLSIVMSFLGRWINAQAWQELWQIIIFPAW